MSELEEILLPTKKISAERVNPKRLIIYSKPKAGKTTALAGLDNCLILDLENGSDYVSALKIKVKDLQDLKKIGETIKKANNPYKYVAIDTVTALEEMVSPLALKLYRDTPIGKNFGLQSDGTYNPNSNVLTLPNGAGYSYLREAFFKILDYIDTLAENIILLGHLKDKSIEVKGKEVNAAEVDLTGKIKSIVCAKADAIGFLYRENNKTIVSFKTSDTITCGARPEHLRNREIVLAEQLDNGEIKTYWENIYK